MFRAVALNTEIVDKLVYRVVTPVVLTNRFRDRLAVRIRKDCVAMADCHAAYGADTYERAAV